MPKDGHKSYVEISHQRCRKYNIEEERVISRKFVRGHGLNQLMADNQALIVTAKPFVEQLLDFVRGSHFFAILTDREGCILTISGDDDIVEKARSFEMVPGAYMSEDCIGTNAMGTAIVEDMPVQITGKEHFIKAYHTWSCSGAPIHDEHGNIIGSLDLTGNSDSVHCHTLGMVVAAVKAIESAMILKQSNQQLKNSNSLIKSLFNSIREGILHVDKSGKILSSNQQACSLLGYRKKDLESHNIREFFEDWEQMVDTMIDTDLLNEEVRIKANRNKIYFSVSIYHVDGHDTVNGHIVVIEDVKKVRKLANRILGTNAIYTFDMIIGRSSQMLETVAFAKKVSDSKSTVLITGESGCGKELFAQAIQNHSNRKDEPFVAINCGAIPRTLIESELFGYEEGAFTGAKRGGQVGKFEVADGGTIFLDEIGELPIEMQPKLLRVIEEGRIVRIGGSQEVPINVRIIAATNKNLKEEVERGNFRRDLYYRLNVIPIQIPPLRERKSDIPLLVEYFMSRISKRINKKRIEITDQDMAALMMHHWPGNVRELENFIEFSLNREKVALDVLEIKAFNQLELHPAPSLVSLEQLEKTHIVEVLESMDYNITNAAKILGVGRNTLYRKLDKYEIETKSMIN